MSESNSEGALEKTNATASPTAIITDHRNLYTSYRYNNRPQESVYLPLLILPLLTLPLLSLSHLILPLLSIPHLILSYYYSPSLSSSYLTYPTSPNPYLTLPYL